MERLKEIEKIALSVGNHKSIDQGACIMELVSYVADEPWSDQPKCVCPILTTYTITLNDRFNDEHRQRLKSFIPLLLNTKLNDETQIARKRLIMWRNVTATYPILLDLFNMPELANQFREIPNTIEGMAKAKTLLVENNKQIYACAYAYACACAYSCSCAYSYSCACSCAYAYSYSYADADSKKLRQQLADVAIETLRMAIDVKVEKTKG
jgi:hypothetical protein